MFEKEERRKVSQLYIRKIQMQREDLAESKQAGSDIGQRCSGLRSTSGLRDIRTSSVLLFKTHVVCAVISARKRLLMMMMMTIVFPEVVCRTQGDLQYQHDCRMQNFWRAESPESLFISQ
jgi:hypothetical protein